MDTFYPIHDYGPLMKGMVIGGMGIFHVFLAQFAIGGGMLMCLFEWLTQRGALPQGPKFLHGYFRLLVLVSFVTGALTGVGMWFTSIQVSPQTIGLMIDEFHWLWAVEWTFFSLEIAAGYAFYRAGERLPGKARLRLLGLYTIGGWFSLFWINGILSWQLTPGGWLDGGGVWAGFFNPSFWPSLVFRTFVCMTLAALAALLVINLMKTSDEDRRALSQKASWLLAPMAVMPLVGLWFLAVLPEDSRGWALGGSAAMTNFLMIAVGSSTLLGLYALIGIWRKDLAINTATAALLLALAFGATAGGEFVREGVRKPYTVREALYSNAIRPDAIARLRAEGSVRHDPYPLRDEASYPNEQLKLGARVYRMQCAVCHTIDGVNGVMHLAGTWDLRQRRLNLARLQHTKAFMPPFAGDAAELEALVQLIGWIEADRPDAWPLSQDPATLLELYALLEEAGTDAHRHNAPPKAPLRQR
jgi:cytochrome d ubiquinol oxidase subunit I